MKAETEAIRFGPTSGRPKLIQKTIEEVDYRQYC